MERYESEYTLFLREMRGKHPEWAEEQLAGRALLWNKKVDLAEQQRLYDVRDLQRPSPYGVNSIGK